MTRKINQKRTACYLLSFFVPVILMLIISISYGFYPFGKTSILMADMRYQFVDYYGYLKYIFFGNNDFFYNFSKTLGGDMLGFSSYYLNSPPNLLLLFFPNEYLPVGILLMAILLIGCSGLTFNMMLDKLFTTRWASLIFSTAYAMMGFLLAYFNCTHYFFNIALLPLVIRGLCVMVRTGKPNLLYTVTLFLSIFSNYYMGYMTCLFSVIFFFYEIFAEAETLKKALSCQKAFFSYVITSIIAVALSAFTLLPTAFSLAGQKGGASEANLSLSRNFYLREFFSGLYNSAFHGNISDGLPIIYCGVTTVVCVILFLVNKKISLRERLASLLALGVMFCCLYVNALNIIWHGFNAPIGFPYRDSFFFSFLLLFIGYKGFLSTANGLGYYQGILCLAAFVLYSGYLIFTHNVYAGRDQIVITGMILLIGLFFLYGFRNKKEYVIPLTVGLFLLQAGDLLYNGYVSIGGYFPDLKENPQAYSMQEFQDYYKNNKDLIDEIMAEDPAFYRMEKLYRRSHNDAMLLGYHGLSHFSSCETEQVKHFMDTLGFRNNENWVYYGHGSTSFADSILGIKYVLSQHDEYAKPYPQLKEKDGIYLYKNSFALPLAFVCNERIETVKKGNRNKFTYQNAIASAMTDSRYDIYKPALLSTIELNNVEQTGSVFTRVDASQDASVIFRVRINCEDFLYMYFEAPEKQDTTIVVDGLEKEPYFTTYGWSVRETGHFKQGQQIDVEVRLNQDTIEIDNASFYYENAAELARWYNDMAEQGKSSLDKITSSHLVGKIEAGEDGLAVFSIPQEESWVIRVDGVATAPRKVLGALTAIPVKAGVHEIEMKYIPKGLKEGILIALLALTLLVFLLIYNKRESKSETTR